MQKCNFCTPDKNAKIKFLHSGNKKRRMARNNRRDMTKGPVRILQRQDAPLMIDWRIAQSPPGSDCPGGLK
ncbi:hypothetical protein [Desulfonema magnum]|uniref:hypothetical protein n=1 Tax=Desulfonema magnum TaxID=45655 RepID=UPI001A9B8B20|nr:hypothetical protein [Desulfonema magnum]